MNSIIAEKVPFGFGVLFPDIDWDLDTPESPASITADRTMLLKRVYDALSEAAHSILADKQRVPRLGP